MTGSAKVYELRIYHVVPGKLDSLAAGFRDYTDKLFSKHGIKSVAYWTALDEPAKSNKLFYILEHASREAAAANWKAFQDDLEWKAVKAKFEENGNLVEKIDSTYLTLTELIGWITSILHDQASPFAGQRSNEALHCSFRRPNTDEVKERFMPIPAQTSSPGRSQPPTATMCQRAASHVQMSQRQRNPVVKCWNAVLVLLSKLLPSNMELDLTLLRISSEECSESSATTSYVGSRNV
jgi:hypothetical protein